MKQTQLFRDEEVLLGDLCEIVIGKTPSRKDLDNFGEDYIWVSIGDMNEKYIEDSKEKITAKGVKESNSRLIPAGTLLLSFKLSLGKVAITKKPLYTNEAIAALIPKRRINIEYLYYYLEQVDFSAYSRKAVKGLCLNKRILSKIKIKLVPMETQDKLVSILQKAEQLKQWREESDKLTDDYLKSVFSEMFGPRNPQYDKWKEVQLQELASDKKGSMRTGPFGSNLRHSEFVDKGVAVLGIDNAVNNYFCWKERRYITEEKYQKLKRYRVYPDDVIITIMGTVGRSAVIPKDIPLAINTKHLVAITLDQQLANPYFVSYSIHSNPKILRQLHGRNRGAIMHGLNLSIIKGLRFKLPPISLQNRFATIFKQIRKMKEVQKQSKQHIENLFNTLLQKRLR